MDYQKLKRDALKFALGQLLRWDPLEQPQGGFSIVLGVPWALRHLLPVNLHFVSKTDLSNLKNIHIVFDRPEQDSGPLFIKSIKKIYPDLPLTFRFHPALAGKFVERINQSKFYASMNWTIGLSECETRYAVMHDFDLYPLKPNYFSSMYEAMRDRQLRFTGLELTKFDGLDSSHKLIGTWALGIDVEWIRENFRPIDCFHTVRTINGRRFDLDAFTYIQSNTPQRALVDVVNENDMAHVRNLCSTYLRFSKGEAFDVVWRLHLMWYLESLCGLPGRLSEIINAMKNAKSAKLKIDNLVANFENTHVTCANVLRTEVFPMENFLHGKPRTEVIEYIDAFEQYLRNFGKKDTLRDAEGKIIWSETIKPGVANQ